MSAIFNPPKPDNSLQREQMDRMKEQEEEADKRAAEEREKADARMRAARAGRGAGRSLLVGATEQGVKGGKKDKLG